MFNFASPASPVDYARLGVETLEVGSGGTTNALNIAKRYNAKFLHASTSECYGDPDVHPQTEDYWGHVNPIGPRSVYDEAKRFSEALTMAYHRYYGVDTRLVRIFNTYGPRLQKNDGRVISNFMVQALKGEDLTVYGEGNQTRSFCYVSDEIEGILGLSRTDEHLPLSHIAEVTHGRGFVWDSISVESSGGLNPLVVAGLAKSSASYFVEHVRERINQAAPPTAQQPRR